MGLIKTGHSRALLFSLFVGLILPAPAPAHTRWSNGDPVPGWVKRECCGPDDVHHPLAEQVHMTRDGYKIDGYKHVVPEWFKLPSPDGGWWIFYHEDKDGSQTGPSCFFGPDPGT